MTLLAQVGLVLAATGAITLLLRQWRRHRYLSEIVVAIVALLAVFSLDDALDQFNDMTGQAGDDAKLSRTAAERAGWMRSPLADPNLGAFTEWVRHKLPEDTTFHVFIGSSYPPGFYQWITYRLLPRIEVASTDADWQVFVGTNPGAVGLGPTHDTQEFLPAFTVARMKQ
jgi:hypothetical protein